MYCNHCGQEIDDNAVVCVKCGCETGKKKNAETDAPSAGYWILGFLIPIVGLIIYLTQKNEYPQRSKSAGQGALWSVIISVVISVIYGIVVGSMLGGMVGVSYYY